jgi:hypothetical protein
LQLHALGKEALVLIDVLPTVHSAGLRVGPATSLVLPALLAKTRDDLEALLEASMGNRTSACAMIGRATYESTVTFFYLTSGTLPGQEHKASRFLAVALVYEEQQRLVEEAMRRRHEAGGHYGTKDLATLRDLRTEAVKVAADKLESTDGHLAQTLLRILRNREDKGTSVGYPRVREQLAGIQAHPVVISNLVGGYLRFYSPFSGFVHSTACLKYLDSGRDANGSAIGLRRGKLPVGHSTPLETALIYVPDLLRRYDERFQCGQAERIGELARRRWEVIMTPETALV